MQPDRNLSDEQLPKAQSAPLPVYTPTPNATPETSMPTVSLQPSAISQPEDEHVDTNHPETPLAQEHHESAQNQMEPVHWQAHEYVHHEKSPLWFTLFGFVTLIFMAIAVFVIKDISFAILVPVMAAALLVYTYRPPRLLDYTLSKHGLHVNDRLYSFTEFTGFRVIHDGEEYSILLVPVKRFKLGLSIYFPEERGEAIVDMLGARLPMEEHRHDFLDRIIRKLRL